MKVIINKYLRDIGINEDNYWILAKENQNDNRYKEDEEGFIEAETWNLDSTLAMINYSYLCYFREHCLHGCPANMTMEKWKKIIDSMILAFELMIKEDNTKELFGKELIEYSKNKQKKINFGLRMFIKYFSDLWW